jgi:hypothetical protein
MQQPPPPPPSPPPQPQQVPAAYLPAPTNTLAIVSLASGVLCWVVVPFVGAIVAVITGHLAKREIRRTGEQGDMLATVGLILGYVHLVLVVGFVLLLFVGAFAFLTTRTVSQG